VSVPVPVYQIVLRLGCGGLEKMVVHLARALDPGQYRVTVCCLEDPGELAAELHGSHVPVVSLGKHGFSPSTVARLARRLRREHVRIVHTHNPGAHLYGTVAAKMAGVPAVVHTRHGPRVDAARSSFFFRRWLSNWTCSAVGVSQDTAQLLVQSAGIAAEKVTMIANGVPIPRIRPEDRAAVRGELGIPEGAPTIGIVARLSPEKEHRTLLTAFAHLTKTVPAAHLLIVGDGPLRNALETQVLEAGIARQVHLTGFRTDVDRMLAAMDVFVLCSSFEGTSLTLLEAMGAGLPIVATAVGGTPEVIGSPANALLVPARDAEALSRALVAALSQPDATRAMAARAQARMKAHYETESMARQYEELYRRVQGGSFDTGKHHLFCQGLE
jgi:sugar transferase (PEP-CTERM/EpsH1 system associated)